MHRYRLLRRFGLARTNDTVNDGSRYIHRSLGEVDVTPFQAEQLALPKAGGYCQENQRSFSDGETVDQRLISAGIKTVGVRRRFALWRTRWIGLRSNNSYRQA